MLKPKSKKSEPIPETDPATEKVIPRTITAELTESYLDYAMSVIVARALPDVRDGLKPVHRRILYAMWDMGLKANAKFRKSATVVGEVLGKYHPHGDVAVYDSMVRMAQNFSLRYPLIRGQGNFGSVDGDSAAAMRYTEAKLASISEELLSDIDRETVNFVPNYDGVHKEPRVLPGRLPNLLLNGTMGIAVGMATNIPPHNLTELCDGIAHLIDHPDATVEDLTQFVQGPDFPTGGMIYNKKDILATYATGRGGIVVRGKAEIEEGEGKRGDTAFRIVITEIPYQVNKANLVTKIAELVQEKKIEGIRDLRDESDREGMRIVVELKKDAYPKKVLNQLYNSTELQTTFHVNMLALVDGIQPRVLNLKNMLEEYVKHRKEVVRRRAEFDLARAKERAHILEGLHKALDAIDAVIATIKKSKDREDAKRNLITKFKLTEIQANAILEMKLSQLAHLEQQKIEDELKEKRALIKELETLLASHARILSVVKQETADVKKKYGDLRRTAVVSHGVKEFSVEDLIPNEPTVVLITRDGYIKRMPPETFKTQGRGGKGVIGATTKEEDIVDQIFSTTTHADLLFFTSSGRVFQLKAYEVPAGSRTAKGQALQNFLQLSPGEKVTTVLTGADLESTKFLVMTTRKAVTKKVSMEDFANVRRSGLIAIKLKTEDVLEWVKPSTGNDQIIIATAEGQAIRFPEKVVRAMGRVASGVRGMRLKKKGDRVVGMDTVDPSLSEKGALELLIITADGFGKRTLLKEFRVQGRGGSGIMCAKVTPKTGPVVGSFVINRTDERDLLLVSEKGQIIRTPLKAISSIGRVTQGVRVMRFKEEGDRIASVTLV